MGFYGITLGNVWCIIHWGNIVGVLYDTPYGIGNTLGNVCHTIKLGLSCVCMYIHVYVCICMRMLELCARVWQCVL